MVPQPILPCLLELPWPNSALTYPILLFQIINTYTEAVQTVDPFKATGKPHTLWVAFAKFYEDNGQLDDVSELHLCMHLRTGLFTMGLRGGQVAGSHSVSAHHHRPVSS